MSNLRELDVKIAKLLGFEVRHLNQKYGLQIDYQAYKPDDGDNVLDNYANEAIITMGMVDGWELKRFSTDIKHAFRLIEGLEGMGRAVILQNDTHEANQVWYVRNFDIDTLSGISMMSRGWKPHEEIETEAKTLQEAIVLFMIEAKELGYI